MAIQRRRKKERERERSLKRNILLIMFTRRGFYFKTHIVIIQKSNIKQTNRVTIYTEYIFTVIILTTYNH